MTDRPHTIHLRSSNNRALAALLATHPSVIALSLDDALLTVRVTDHAALSRALPVAAQRGAISLFEVRPADESLEHVFSYLVQR